MRRAEMLVAALAAFGVLALLVAPLSTPYWWDAGAVYAPGAKWLLDHGFDARPGVFPDDLSRGHPPLFFLLLAGAFRLGGPGPVAGHALAFAFGWAAMVLTYALGREIFSGHAAGTIAAMLLASAPLFLTMSSEALPEAPLTALTAAAFYAFARQRLAACAALGTLLVLVKETGVACPVAIALTLAVEAARAKKLREEAPRIALALAPAGVLAAFFLYQRAAAGWFVTPNHAELFGETYPLGQVWRVVRSVVFDDGRVVAVVAACACAWSKSRTNTSSSTSCVLLALALHAALNLLFFARSFYLERYTLPVHVGVAVALGGALASEGEGPARRLGGLLGAALAVAVALSRREAGTGTASGETSFRYLHAVHAYSAVYRRMEAEGGSPVVLTAWPITDALHEPFLGWVRRPFPCIEVGNRREGERFDRVVIAEGLGSHDRLVEEARAAGFRRLDREEEGGAAIEVWGP
jgi:4-amino-4-deoxy-L-arabinose transferase-like glycosyltransferase